MAISREQFILQESGGGQMHLPLEVPVVIQISVSRNSVKTRQIQPTIGCHHFPSANRCHISSTPPSSNLYKAWEIHRTNTKCQNANEAQAQNYKVHC